MVKIIKEFVCYKKHYIKALEMIKEKDSKLKPIDKFCHRRKTKIINYCNWDKNIENRRRQNLDVMPTKLQLLLMELKTNILKHDWGSAARCIQYMLKLNGNLLPVIWKSLLIVLLNHPESTKQNLVDFLQMVLCLRTPQEQEKFIMDVLTLPEDLSTLNLKKRRQEAESESEEEEIF